MAHIEFKVALIGLLLLSFSFAVVPFTQFSCLPAISYQNSQFFEGNYNSDAAGTIIGNCTGTTERFNNIILDLSLAGNEYSAHSVTVTGSTSGTFNIQMSGFSIGGAFLKVKYFGGVANNSLITHTGACNLEINGIPIRAENNLNITVLNSTAYKITNGTKSVNVTIGSDIIFTNFCNSMTLPLMNVTNLTQFYYANPPVACCIPIAVTTTFSTPFGLAIENGLLVIGSSTSSGTNTAGPMSKSWGPGIEGTFLTPTTQFYNATLTSPASLMLVPSVSYYAAVGQGFSSMFNSTAQLTKVKNNSVLFAYDTTSSQWYDCPPYAAPNQGPFSITCFPIPFSGSSGAGVFNVWRNVNFSLTPEDSSANGTTNISFTVSTNDSRLEYFGMSILNVSNGTQTLIFAQTINSSTGGTISDILTADGLYYINVWFKHLDSNETISPLTKIFSISTSPTGFLAAKQDFLQMNGWVYYLFALIISAGVTGWLARYVADGAGVGGLLCLWLFTYLYPGAQIACVAGYNGVCLTATIATSITTLLVLGAIYLRQYI